MPLIEYPGTGGAPLNEKEQPVAVKVFSINVAKILYPLSSGIEITGVTLVGRPLNGLLNTTSTVRALTGMTAKNVLVTAAGTTTAIADTVSVPPR